MGIWGSTLYDNDTTKDIRAEYIDKLRHGKSNEDATEELISSVSCYVDQEEESLFWLALADTQWDYGRLLPTVKDKALWFLSCDSDKERWENSSKNQFDEWNNTLKLLKDKLSSPPPPPKRVSRHSLFRCPWELGDVFAYRLSSKYSKQMGFWGKYIIFRKVSEDVWHPGHIVPVVQVYNWVGENIPQLNELSRMSWLPAFCSPTFLSKHPNKDMCFRIKLISESPKAIPQNNLFFVGNVSGDDLTPFLGNDYWTGYGAVGWENSNYNNTFEKYVIDTYLEWQCNSNT